MDVKAGQILTVWGGHGRRMWEETQRPARAKSVLAQCQPGWTGESCLRGGGKDLRKGSSGASRGKHYFCDNWEPKSRLLRTER